MDPFSILVPHCSKREQDGLRSIRDEDDEILCYKSLKFFRRSVLRSILKVIFSVITLGVSELILRWFPRLRTILTLSSVPGDGGAAEFALVESQDEIISLVKIETILPGKSTSEWTPVTAIKSRAVRDSAGPSSTRSFVWRSERFWLHPKTGAWERVRFNEGQPYSQLHAIAAHTCCQQDDSSDDRAKRLLTYGPNILLVQSTPFLSVLASEILKPFFAFQVFSVGVWLGQKYYAYSAVIASMTIISTVYEAVQTWRNLRDIRRLAEVECPITKVVATDATASSLGAKVTGEGATSSPSPSLHLVPCTSSELLPGDVVLVDPGLVFPCDLILLSGQCVVNESMLTGESAPVLKSALPVGSDGGQGDQQPVSFRSDLERDAKYRLMSGTRVLSTRRLPPPPSAYSSAAAAAAAGGGGKEALQSVWDLSQQSPSSPLPVLAMVSGTGFSTAKGRLVRAILYPKPSSFDFEKKLYYFVFNLALVMLISIGITLYYQIGKEPASKVILNILNIITVTIPPALPLALSIGLSVSFTRLQSLHSIYCISPPRIVNAGRVNTLCFDKTGTLTQDGLSVLGVCPVIAATSGVGEEGASAAAAPPSLADAAPSLGHMEDRVDSLLQPQSTGGPLPPLRLALSRVLAACHSLSILEAPHTAEAAGGERRRSSSDGSSGRSSSGGRVTWWHRVFGGWGSTGYKRATSEVQSEDVEEDGGWGTGAGGEARGGPRRSGAEEAEEVDFVGDPLEIQMFLESGWRFLPRPDPSHLPPQPTTTPSSTPSSWDTDPASVWSNPDVPPLADAVLLPPATAVPIPGVSSYNAPPPLSALAVLRRFDFDADLRRMSVLVAEVRPSAQQSRGGDPATLWLLAKGAPESMFPQCTLFSLPPGIASSANELAAEGHRLLATAARQLPREITLEQALTLPRGELERQMTFSGLLVLENKLKAETVPFLDEFSAAGLRSIMVTGDNALTALAVARKCGANFLLPNHRPFLLELSRPSTNPAAAAAGSGGSGCVLTDTHTQQQVRLDDLLEGRSGGAAAASDLENPQSTSPVGGPAPSSDLVVTGPAFAALRQQHEALAGAPARQRRGSSHTPPSPTPLELVLTRACVFARMTPSQKQELMLSLRDLGYVPCMTGDGANDSGALKAAEIGLSIAASSKGSFSTEPSAPGEGGGGKGKGRKRRVSEHDVSVNAAPSIAAPFSSPIAHIGALKPLLQEGRCALVSATTMFKYMLFYGLIQTTAIMVLYPHELELADNQYLWADLALVFPIVLLLPSMRPSKKLTRGQPQSDLLAFSVLFSVYSQAALIVVFQIIASDMLHSQSWYSQPAPDELGFNEVHNANSTASFLFSSFQYTLMALALTQTFGRFRASLFSNPILCLVLLAQFICNSIFLLAPSASIMSAFNLVSFNDHPNFQLQLWTLALLNGLLFIVFEHLAAADTASVPDTRIPGAPPASSSRAKASKVRFASVESEGRPLWSSLASS